MSSQSAELQFPDFFDFQDYFNPVFRLELNLKREDYSIRAKDTYQQMLDFSLQDDEIMNGF